jgi:hypothetical protein
MNSAPVEGQLTATAQTASYVRVLLDAESSSSDDCDSRDVRKVSRDVRKWRRKILESQEATDEMDNGGESTHCGLLRAPYGFVSVYYGICNIRCRGDHHDLASDAGQPELSLLRVPC